jgi:hypothetical protein
MSVRRHQVQTLGRELARLTGVGVEVVYDGECRYLVQWTDGPMLGCMRGLVVAGLSGGQYPDLPVGLLTYARGHSVRAFASRACATQRSGALASAIRMGVLERRRLAMTRPSWHGSAPTFRASHARRR